LNFKKLHGLIANFEIKIDKIFENKFEKKYKGLYSFDHKIINKKYIKTIDGLDELNIEFINSIENDKRKNIFNFLQNKTCDTPFLKNNKIIKEEISKEEQIVLSKKTLDEIIKNNNLDIYKKTFLNKITTFTKKNF